MFGRNYYTLVAGLREYTLDTDAKSFDAAAVIGDILEELSPEDAREVRLHYAYYDCRNLIALNAGRAAHNPLGNLSHEELLTAAAGHEYLPREVVDVLRARENPEGEEAETAAAGGSFAQALMEAYYLACARSGSRFQREWAEFDRNLRNVTAAVTARRAGRPADEVTVGGGEVVEALQRSSAADFGLRGELDYMEALISALGDEENILEKEHRIDRIRWEKSAALAEFDYFNVDAILSYLVRLDIVARWTQLDEKRSRELFSRLLAELEGGQRQVNTNA